MVTLTHSMSTASPRTPDSPESHFASSAETVPAHNVRTTSSAPQPAELRNRDDVDFADDASILTHVSSRKSRLKRRRVMPGPTIVLRSDTENDISLSLPLPSQPTPKPNLGPLLTSFASPKRSSLPPPMPSHPIPVFNPADIPSPPPTSSNDGDTKSVEALPPLPHSFDGRVATKRTKPARPRTNVIEEQSKSPTCSEDSLYFSFSDHEDSLPSPTWSQDSKRPLTADISTVHDAHEVMVDPPEEASQATVKKPYYTKAFDYVLCDVLSRYRDVLHQNDVDLARFLQQSLTENALSFFVRLYRRKHQWLRVDGLTRAYESELDVPSSVRELCNSGLLVSSSDALRVVPEITPLLARELLSTLPLSDIRAVCASVVEGHVIRRLPKAQLLPKLRGILTEKASSSCRINRKFRQSTLSGLSPSGCLARAILNRTGHCVILPINVLTSLARVHFLFFLESGHDSPNVILADTGKVRFPSYTCNPCIPVIPSSAAYDDFESAIEFEKELAAALDANDLARAASLSSIAELEVRRFYKERVDASAHNREVDESLNTARSYVQRGFQGCDSSAKVKSQLKHPFLRRYSAPWVYARACWHSVQALEKLGEYEGAICRLKLLLETKLMARRRGKCLNRLTINLFRNVHRPKEALDVIIDALREDSHVLTYGDKLALAQRGAAIHRVLYASEFKEQLKGSVKSERLKKKPNRADADRLQPAEIAKILLENATKVAVRKIHGKSLKILRRERRKRIDEVEDGWQRFLVENSRDSIASASDDGNPEADMDVMGKAIFKSLDGTRGGISVEQYCLDWYFAKEGWTGRHDEGGAVRFLFGLLMWESVLFADVDDVFQTPYQDRPLDLITEAFYASREKSILERIREIKTCSRVALRKEVMTLYDKFSETRAIGCSWKLYTAEELGCIAAGLGPEVVALCCHLLCEDYSYWGGGLPDLTLWKVLPSISDVEGDSAASQSSPCQLRYDAKLVEVKSARDNLSDRQRAWLVQLAVNRANCEVCKVVENLTALNSVELEDAKLDYTELRNLAASKDSLKDE